MRALLNAPQVTSEYPPFSYWRLLSHIAQVLKETPIPV
jgi:hypothetical protein